MAISAGDVVVQFGGETRKFDQAVNHVESRMKSTGDKMTKWGKNLSMRMTAPLVAFAGFAVKTAASYSKSMAKVKAVTGATVEQFEELDKVAKELGATTQFTASQVAEAMSFMGMAGYKTNEILAALPHTLNLAAAGALDMGQAADLVTNIMAGYGMTIEQLPGAVDVLAKAFTTANIDLVMLGESMKYAGPVAKGFGMTFEETAAIVGIFGNAGIQGSMAGTSLRQAIVQLDRKAAKFGITMYDATGKMLPFADILEQLEQKGFTASQMMELFGARAGPALMALLEEGSTALREYTQSLEDSGGTAENIAKTQMEGLHGMLIKLKSAFEGLQLAIVNELMPVLVPLLDKITALLRGFSRLPPFVKKTVVMLGLVAAAIGPILLLTGMLIKAYIMMKGLTIAMIAFTHGHTIAMVAHKIAQIAAIGVTKMLTIVQWAWNAAMNANPIGAIIMLIGLLVAAGIYLWKNWDKVVAFFKSAWRRIKLFFLTGVEKVLGILAKFTAWIPFVGDKVAGLHDKIANMIDAEKLGSDAEQAARTMAEFTEKVGEAAEDMVADVKQATETAIQSAEQVADAEKQSLEERAQLYRDMHYERMDLIDEQMLAEIRAVDPVLAAEIEGYNKEIEALEGRGEARKEEAEEARKEALELQLAKDDLASEEEERLQRELGNIEDTQLKRRLIEERNLKMSELDMDNHFEMQKSLVDTQLHLQIAAYNTELLAFTILNAAKLDDAQRFVREYNEIMAGLGAEGAYQFEIPGGAGAGGRTAIMRGKRPPAPYAYWEEAHAAGIPYPAEHGGLFTRPTIVQVAERGIPELVLPLDKLGALLGAGAVTNNFQIGQLVVREEADIYKIARELRMLQERTERRVGLRGG